MFKNVHTLIKKCFIVKKCELPPELSASCNLFADGGSCPSNIHDCWSQIHFMANTIRKSGILWGLPKCVNRDMKWANTVGKMACSRQGCHRPCICKKTTSVKYNKMRYTSIRLPPFTWMELAIFTRAGLPFPTILLVEIFLCRLRERLLVLVTAAHGAPHSRGDT